MVAKRIQSLINEKVSNGKISKPMHGIVANIRTGREVNSASSLREITAETHPDLYAHNLAAYELSRAEGIPESSINKIGACAEAQGCALLLDDPAFLRAFVPEEYVTYSYIVDVTNIIISGVMKKKVVITPHNRCVGICSRLKYLLTPTDKVSHEVSYTFIFDAPA